jgi:hypothetical protein
VVTKISKLDLKWTPKKEEMIARGNLEKMLETKALGENKRHIQ